MARSGLPLFIIALAGAGAIGWSGVAMACTGAGVITRIDGQPQDLVITRTDDGGTQTVSRPRVLQVVCSGDVIKAVSGTSVTLSIDGVGPVKVAQNTVYTVPVRSGAPTAIGNAYRSIDQQVLPDMKRLPWNVRLKGAGDDFGFALPALVEGGQEVPAGANALLVRLVGGTAPYKVELRDAQGQLVASQTSENHEVELSKLTLAPGAYKITAADSTPRLMDATFTVVTDPPPAEPAFADLPDPEVRSAASAAALAREATGTWSFEAEQQLASAPQDGLDRDQVYELIESYSAQ